MSRTGIAAFAAVVALAMAAFATACGGDNAAGVATPTVTPAATQTPTAAGETPTATGTAAGVSSATPAPATATTSPVQPATATPGPTGGTSPPPAPSPTLPPDRKAVPAPIDKLDVVVLASFPPQYVASIQAGLPDGCTQQYAHSVERNQDVITISVLNSVPARPAVCTQIYGDYELDLNLGSQFQPGTTYTVQVNDKTTSFTAR